MYYNYIRINYVFKTSYIILPIYNDNDVFCILIVKMIKIKMYIIKITTFNKEYSIKIKIIFGK